MQTSFRGTDLQLSLYTELNIIFQKKSHIGEGAAAPLQTHSLITSASD